MQQPQRNSRFGSKTAFIIGFLFLLLGTSTQAETSWLFVVAGMLSLCQGLYDSYHKKPES